MIDIYTEKKEPKDWILQNDLYFNLNTANEEISQNEINVIKNSLQIVMMNLILLRK